MKRAESTLERTIALLDATLESTHDGVIVTDGSGRIVRYNQQYLDMFRITGEELTRGGLDGLLQSLLPHLERPEAIAARYRVIGPRPEHEVFGVLRFKDGRVVECYVAPHRSGSAIIGAVASFRDVSDSARAHQALERHRVFLEKAQEVAHVGTWVAELDGSERYGWSMEAHRIFGVPLGEFNGTAEAFYSFVHEADRDAAKAAASNAIEGSAPYDIEYRIVRRDGSVRWVHGRADVVYDERGHATRMVGTIQDISDRRELEEQLRQSQKMEAIGRLAGGIAHDLNNALTTIAGYAELALGEITAGQPLRQDIEEICRAAERASSVTRQLLEFSRKRLLEPRQFNLNEIVTGIARLLSRLLGSDIDIVTRPSPNLSQVLGDPGHVEQAIINLAVNARDAMPNGGRLDLATTVETVDDTFARTHVPITPGRYVVLRVSDTGHGIPPDIQNRVFEPFFTTKEAGKGTGLGLSMVYGTLKQTGGFVFVDSAVGSGTTFSLYFPPIPAATVQTAPASDDAASRRGGGETLLVVEDEAAVRMLVAAALKKEGYELLIACSAAEAQAIAEHHQDEIDLVLTDAIMPGRTGIDLARDLVARRPGLPVILMSGYTEDMLAVKGLEPPFSVLQKPFTPRELRQRIREVLDR